MHISRYFKFEKLAVKNIDETMLHLEVWDYDKFSSDDLIGSTSIDLEQRINSDEWKKLSKKPIEYR